LPVSALRFHPATAAPTPGSGKGQGKGGRRGGTPGAQASQAVYVLEPGKLKRVPVKLGLTDGNYTEVLSGLTEGQQVVTGTATNNKAAPATTQQGPGTRRLGF